MEQVKRLPADTWSYTEVGRVMTDLRTTAIVGPDVPVNEVMEQIGKSQHALVLSDGRLVGLIGPEELRRSLQHPPSCSASSPMADGQFLVDTTPRRANVPTCLWLICAVIAGIHLIGCRIEQNRGRGWD